MPAGMTTLYVGNSHGQLAANAPVEFLGYRRGTFNDAELTALLAAL
jgi:hypothetical protein